MSLNQNSSKIRDFVQAFGPQLSIFYYLVLVPLLTFSQWKKPYSRLFSAMKF